MKSSVALFAVFLVLLQLCSAQSHLEPAALNPSPTDWVGVVEKVGLVGFLAIMVRYFQTKNDAMQERSEKFADRALTCLERNSETTRDLTDAVALLKTAIEVETREVGDMRRAIERNGRSQGA